MSKTLKSYLFLFTLVGAIIAFDQWTKYLVRLYIPFGGQWAPWDWLLPYARLVHWQNTGAAFGMFQRFGDVFKVLAMVVSAVIVYYFPRVPEEDWWLRLALAMQCGGALGNLVDRFTQGYVTDFVSVGNFAVFNVADSSISVGVAILLVGVWFKERAQARAVAASSQAAALTVQPPSAEIASPDAVETPSSE